MFSSIQREVSGKTCKAEVSEAQKHLQTNARNHDVGVPEKGPQLDARRKSDCASSEVQKVTNAGPKTKQKTQAK
jgi:hypothetical protein